MKKSIKAIITGLMACCFVNSIYAFDFGASLAETLKIKDGAESKTLNPDWNNKAVVWERYAFDNSGNSYVAIQTSFGLEKDFAVPESDFSCVLDLDILKAFLTKEFGSASLEFSAGRFYNSDLTGMIISQNLDGLGLKLNLSGASIGLNAGYTGLLNALTTSIIDQNGAVYGGNGTILYNFAESYLVAGLNLELPNLFANQTLTIESWETFKFDRTQFNRVYATLGLNGPLFSSIYYNLSSTVGMLSQKESDLAISNLSNISLAYYADNFSLTLNGVYASGEVGPFKPFVGFTSQTAFDSYAPVTEYSSLLKSGLAVTFKPLQNLLMAASADAIFNAKQDISFSGVQYSANIDYQLFSDISCGASINQYFDMVYSIYNKTNIEVKASIAF